MRIQKLFLKIIIFITIALCVVFLVLFCCVFIASFYDNAQKADAIVVLGAAQWDGQPSPMFQARLDHAYDLYTKGYASQLLLTGGIGNGQTVSEAEVGAEYLRNKGVLSSAILAYPFGSTTLQSLNSVSEKMKQNNIKSSILVSHDFHTFRLKKMAKDIGMNAVVSPVESNSFFSKLKYLLRESIVYIIYILFEI